MDSFEEFLRRISRRFSKLVPASKIAQMMQLDPNRIYVENVRSILGSPSWLARFICELGVRRGVFEKKVQVLCPDGAAVLTASSADEVPTTVLCWEESDGDWTQTSFESANLQKLEFYSLARRSG